MSSSKTRRSDGSPAPMSGTGAAPGNSAGPTATRPAMGTSVGGGSTSAVRVSSAPSTPMGTAAPRPTHDEIARAAYARWKKQGGDPVLNWLEAERELMSGGVKR